MKSILHYLYKDKVFVIAFVFALISMFFIPPSSAYLGYINAKVLIIMFTLMLAVAGIYETHFFDFVATKLVMHLRSIKWIGLVIVLVTFFLAMLLTNDAVLLTLIPFTMFITRHTKQEKHMITIIILQTIAANMGSALTPMGDPQNIYLYAFYNIPFTSFILTTSIITLTGFILILLTGFISIPHQICELNIVAPNIQWKKFLLYMLIMINALLCVLRIIDPYYALGITLILSMIYGRHLFKRVDYTLLLTFVCFFIFTGNISKITWISDYISQGLSTHLTVYFTALLTSQFISNVPAAVLLSTFTSSDYWQPLLQGVNVGALGSIIGSLASLISFKYILREYPKKTSSYLLRYTLISLGFMIVITLATLLIRL